ESSRGTSTRRRMDGKTFDPFSSGRGGDARNEMMTSTLTPGGNSVAEPNVRTMDVLIIEDDDVLGRALRRGLEESGPNCTWGKNGDKGLAQATAQKSDTIILDLLLPDQSGLEVLRKLRAQ